MMVWAYAQQSASYSGDKGLRFEAFQVANMNVSAENRHSTRLWPCG
jgi:hypothetical protein